MICRPALVAAFLLAVASCGQAPETQPAAPPDEAAVEVPWVIVSAHPLATDAGARVLSEGGSAVDAAVAVQAVLGLVEPQSSGLGGGSFMLHYDAESGELVAFDGRETAPMSAHPDIFIRADGTPMSFIEAVTSGFSVGVPGAVAMLGEAHTRYGRLPWSALFSDAERLASEGFAMPQRLHDTLARVRDLLDDPQAAVYLDAEGARLGVGQTVRNPAYADTVRQIAEGGAAAFYTGPIAEAIIARVNGRTGQQTLTLADFAAYEPLARAPVCAIIRLRTVCSMPPPSSGGVTLLQIMRLFEITSETGPEDDLLSYIEASRLAFADRGRFLGDPTAMGTEELSAEDLTAILISTEYLSERAELIGEEPAETVEPGDPDGIRLRDELLDDSAYEVPSTSHFSIRDSRGNMISMTTTVESAFGSQMMAAGMVLNNQLTDFARVPRDGNQLAVNAPGAGKRPMSSMSPTLVFGQDGEPYAAIGSPGGPAIIGYVARPLLDHLMTEQKLSETAREAHIVVPRGTVIVEQGADDLAAAISALGYEVSEYPLSSGLYGFVLTNEGIDLVVDPRREGAGRTSAN